MIFFTAKTWCTLVLVLMICVIFGSAQDMVFSQQPNMDIPDVGATDSPQYYANMNPSFDVNGSDIPEDLIL